MAQYDVNLRDYWRILKKRKSVIAVIVAAIVVFSYGFAGFQEPEPLYEAEAAIKIDRRARQAGFWVPPEDISTHAYTVTSFPVILMTAQWMGDLPRDITMDDVRADPDRFALVQSLKARVSGRQEPGTNIINITAVDRDPETAATIANAVAAAYQEYDVAQGNQKINDTRAFVERQMELTWLRLEEAERELRRFVEGHGIFSMDLQVQDLLKRIEEVRQDHDAISEEILLIERLLVLFDDDSVETHEAIAELIFPGGRDGAFFPELQSRFESLRLERRELLLRYTPEHPRVVAIDGRIRAVIDESGKKLQTRRDHLLNQKKKAEEREQELKLDSKRLPDNAQKMAELQRNVDLINRLYAQLQGQRLDLMMQASGTMADVSIVKPALAPAQPFNIPSKALIVFTGLILGLIVGFVAALGLEAFDTSMGTIEDLEGLLQVPVLGVIPSMIPDRKDLRSEDEAVSDQTAGLITHYHPKSLAAEAFRTLRTNLQALKFEKKNKSFLVTSSYLQEGKTLNCVNLAVSLAQNGAKVLLIEADLRRSSIHKIFGLNREPGLTDYIMGNYRIDEIRNTLADIMVGDLEIDDVLKHQGLDTLHIITAGTKPQNPSEILSSEQFKTLLRTVYPDYDYILVDVPPVLPVADASQVASLVDGVVLVYSSGRIARSVLKRARDMLAAVDARVVGVILNSVRPEIGPDYLKYHSNYYYSEAAAGRRGQFPSGLDRMNALASAASQHRTAVGAVALVILLLLIGLFWNLS